MIKSIYYYKRIFNESNNNKDGGDGVCTLVDV